MDEILGKAFKNIWLTSIAGCALVLIESILNINKLIDAGVSILLSLIILSCAILTRFDINGTSFSALLCAYILFLSPIGFSGFELGILLILVGSLISACGGLLTYTSFFFYVAIGAIIIDIFLLFI